MTLEKAYEDLYQIMGARVKLYEPMRNHCSWRIGGPAQLFVQPDGLDDLKRVLTYASVNGINITIIGNGSNLLVSDQGIEGIVVQIGRGLDYLKINGSHIASGAGVKLSRLAAIARKNEVGGFEFITGIPGTVGGALVMNAGANGSCMADLTKEIVTIDYNGILKKYLPEVLNFGYRTSLLKNLPEVVVEATFKGEYRDRESIQKVAKKYMIQRKKNQPLEYPSAGSVFKNPLGDSAGRLIEMAGCKCLRIGDAQVSSKHANFFINLGNASSKDMLTLIEKVQERVYEKFGVKLILEVQLVGKH